MPFALHNWYGASGQTPLFAYYKFWTSGVVLVLGFAWAVSIVAMLRSGEPRPIRSVRQRLRSIDVRTYVEVFVGVLAVPAVFASLTVFKSLLPKIRGYNADPALAYLDGVFGFQPWELTHAILGPAGTVLLDRTYFLWFVVNKVMLIGIVMHPRLAASRGQVLLTVVASCLVLGIGTAFLLPSVGPCYYAAVYGDPLFAPLMERLAAIDETYPLRALAIQANLWDYYTQNTVAFGSGLSAMPSMHVSLATITALLLRQYGYAWIGWIWVLVIWIGSIHLGWHYASDGIVAAVVTLALWKACSVLLSVGSGTPGPKMGRQSVSAAA